MPRTLLVLALVLAAAGCGGETPVARVRLEAGAAGDGERPSVALGYPEVVVLPLVWEPAEPLPPGDPPLVFVHLVDGSGELVRTFDHPFPAPWRPGTRIEDEVDLYQSALAPPLPAADYRLVIGLYRLDGTRFPLDAGPEGARYEYEMARVEAAGPSADLPRFELSGDWSPVEAGGDLQVLASRWLTGEGRLTIAGAPGPGAVWMRLRVPEPAGDDRLVLDEGAGVQGLRMTSLCGGAESAVSGPGAHEVELPVEAAGDGDTGGGCEIVLSPTFHVVTRRPGEEPEEVRRSVLLDTLAWRSADGSSVGRKAARR